ncbi:MAG: DUF1566 domain-containing protein [Bacteroidales bacterium]|nr:DUF1566 domain-containing protein [Bacteroidales bacterium]
MKNIYNACILSTLSVLALFIAFACEREWDNPWDEKAGLDPADWAPQNLQVENLSITERKLTWTYSGDERIEGFKINRRKGDEPWQVAFQTLPKEARSWNDSEIIPDPALTYQYRIYAFAGAYNSASGSISVVPQIPSPSNLQINPNSITSVTLTWQDNSNGEEGFKIERKYEGGSWEQIAITAGTVWQDNDFDLNTVVYYRINAYFSQNISSWTIIFFDSSIPPPLNLTITVNSGTTVVLNWNFNHTGHMGFKIERLVEPGIWDEIYTTDPNQFSFTDNSPFFVINSYTYRVFTYFLQHNSEKTQAVFTLQMGMEINGGILFYLDGIGSGLVCTGIDQGTGAQWGCYGTTTGSTGTAVGSGALNTTAIVAGCSETGTAARICDELALNGYSDWFLPSKDELNLMYQNLKAIGMGGFTDGYYWSSSECSSGSAWIQRFTSGYQYDYYSKVNFFHVRAVRAF